MKSSERLERVPTRRFTGQKIKKMDKLVFGTFHLTHTLNSRYKTVERDRRGRNRQENSAQRGEDAPNAQFQVHCPPYRSFQEVIFNQLTCLTQEREALFGV